MGEWKPIETAPKDGTPILAFNIRHPDSPPVVVAWKTEPEKDMPPEPHWADAATRAGNALYYNGRYFSHWQPLPKPPSPATGG